MTEQKVETVRGNAVKHERYKYAHERLKRAISSGFHIEGAMICESLLADRLHSHLHWRVYEAGLNPSSFFGKAASCISYGSDEVVTGKRAFVPFGVLIGMYAKCLHDDHRPNHGSPPAWVGARRTVSPATLKYWSEERNAVAHGAVKTHPTRKMYDESFQAFEDRAALCAEHGVALVRLMNNWDAAVRRAHQRQMR